MDSNSFGNPLMSEERIPNFDGGGTMSRSGVFTKLAFLLAIVFAAGAYQMHLGFKAFGDFDFSTLTSVPVEGGAEDETVLKVKVTDAETGAVTFQDPPQFDFGAMNTLTVLGVFIGFAVALIIIFNANTAPFLAPIYAACEGLALGGISVMFEVQFGGITIQAIALTFAVSAAMLVLFASGMIKVTPALMTGIIAATGGVCLLYIADLLLGVFADRSISIIHSSSPAGIGLSLFVCALAAFNLLIDFQLIEEQLRARASKRTEWYLAFGVLVTLVWLYLEILRLMAKLKDSKMIAGWREKKALPAEQPAS